MDFHHKSPPTNNHCSNGIKVLLILLITYATNASSPLTAEEIADAIAEVGPSRYCGKRLTEAMRVFCQPLMRNQITSKQMTASKRTYPSSTDLDFETFDLERMASENYDDEMTRSRYKIDENYYTNDIPFMFSAQGNRRRRRGIIDECCKQPCFKSDLITYCPKKG